MRYLPRLVVLAAAVVSLVGLASNLSATSGAAAQAQPPTASQPAAVAADADTLRAREQQRVDVLVAGDLDKFAAILSPTLTYSHSNGTVQSKDAFMADLRKGQPVFKSVKHRDVTVRFAAPDVAILNGISDFVVSSAGQEQQIPLRFTIVYVRKGGEWLLEAWHSTRRTQ